MEPSMEELQSPAIATTRDQNKVELKVQTLDLEELGLAAALQATHKRQETRIIVDYEDDDRYRPKLRNEEAACLSSACKPVLTANSSNGRLLNHRRSRCSSSEIAALGMARGKSKNFGHNGTYTDSTSAGNSTTDLDEQMRCSKVHKLCMCEVKLHSSLASCWLVSNGQVYDVTGLVAAHPGGVRSILRKAGGPDCAQDMQFHTKKARKIMEKCFIGKLQQCGDDADCSEEANCTIM